MRSDIYCTVSVEDRPAGTVLAVLGEVDSHSAHVLRRRLDEVFDSGRHRLVVDLGRTRLIDSTGLSALVGGLDRARQVGGSLSVVCGQPRIVKLFQVTGLDQVFALYATVEEALAEPS